MTGRRHTGKNSSPCEIVDNSKQKQSCEARKLLREIAELRLKLRKPHQQTVWEFPDASRVPVPKHPDFGRYFWALFEAVTGRDLMTSLDRPRARSSSAHAPKPVAASTAATIPNELKSDFTVIVEPLPGCQNTPIAEGSLYRANAQVPGLRAAAEVPARSSSSRRPALSEQLRAA